MGGDIPQEKESAPETAKKIEEFEQSYPVQLQLFEFLQMEENRYSNTVELYDFMPKYHWGKTERINGKFLETLEREFECKGIKYKIEVGVFRPNPRKLSISPDFNLQSF